MTPTELHALRRWLCFSGPEAARWIAAEDDRPKGVEERTWNRWEAGARPVPDNIAARVLQLVAYRALLLRSWHDQAQAATQAHPLALPWHDDGDDWPDARPLHRPAQSAAAQLLAELGPDRVRLVPFDVAAFRAWRETVGADAHALPPAALHQAWARHAAQAEPVTPAAATTDAATP